MRNLILSALLLASAYLSCSLSRADSLLTDSFDGNIVDATKWIVNTSVPGSSVSAADGSLNLRNRGVITTVGGYSAPLQIEGRFKFLKNETSNFYIGLRT